MSLGGKDLIVNTNAVGHYLAQEDREEQAPEEWKVRPWKGNGLDILWFEKLDHAQVFDSKQSYDMLVDVIIEYSLANEEQEVVETLANGQTEDDKLVDVGSQEVSTGC